MSADLSLPEACRIALAAQGFDRPRPAKVNRGHLRRTLRQLGVLQLDSVNVIIPSHYQVPFARLGAYDPALLDQICYGRGEFVETWSHVRSLLPAEDWPLVHFLRERDGARLERWRTQLEARHPSLLQDVLDHVRAAGPVRPVDVPNPSPRQGKRGSWWDWDVVESALEWHFRSGHLAVVARPNFARVYDLIERALPDGTHAQRPAREEARRAILRRAARACGVGTLHDLADYYRLPIAQARAGIAELLETGELRRVRVEGWKDPAYLYRDARLPKRIEASSLLSPFDPVVWFRPRAERLFGFHYRIELYTPAPQRKYGYYVLPFLQDGRLSGRIDLKADRASGRLLVQASHAEPGERPAEVAAALAPELRAWADWLGLEKIEVRRKGGLAAALRKAFPD